jgi:penicillin-binding protein 1C
MCRPSVCLKRSGPQRLLSRLRRAGIQLELPPGGTPGLAIGLGGAGVSLARPGPALQHHLPMMARHWHLLTAAAVPVAPATNPVDGSITRCSRRTPRGASPTYSGRCGQRRADSPRIAIAYKTGTSYGYRDAWAIGFDGRHVLGVWVGPTRCRPCSGPFRDRSTAAPLLFRGLCAVRAGAASRFSASPPPGMVGPACADSLPYRPQESSAAPGRDRRMRPPEAASTPPQYRLSAARRARGA